MADDKAKRHILKILSGPHLGAEMLLAPGTYLIGSDPECDIILRDQTVAPRHARLTVLQEGLAVSPAEDAAYLDGEKLESQETPLDLHQIVTLGTTHFGIGVEGEPYPLSPLPVIMPEGPSVSEGGDGSEPDRRADPDGPEDPGAAPAEYPEEPDRESSGGTGRLAAAAVLILLLAGVGLFFGFSEAFTSGPEKKLTKTDRIEEIHRLCEKHDIRGVKVVEGFEGALMIQGYLDTAAQKQTLFQAVKALPFRVLLKVRVIERIIDAARETLDAYGLPLEAAWETGGTLVLKGYMGDKTRLRKPMARLREEIPSLERIEDRVTAYESLIPALFQILEAHRVKGDAEFLVYPDHILFQGDLNPESMENWKQAKADILKRYGTGFALRENLQSTEAKPASGPNPAPRMKTAEASLPKSDHDQSNPLPGLQIRGVTLGPVSYVTTSSGIKYFPGGVLDNGFVIKAIRPDGLVLTAKGRDYNLYFRGGE